jgi:hypothetical protein
MPAAPATPDAIAEGADLWVVLTDRFDAEYVESYRLAAVVLLAGGRFWGKFRRVHAPHGLAKASEGVFGSREACSYAYNNFCSLVATTVLERNICRLFSASAYRTMTFRTQAPWRKLWGSDGFGAVAAVSEAAQACRETKLRVTLGNGIRLLLPVAAIELGGRHGFTCHSEYDGFPSVMFDHEELGKLAVRLDAEQSEQGDQRYLSYEVAVGEPFFMANYRAGPGGIEGGNVDPAHTAFRPVLAEVLAEGPP